MSRVAVIVAMEREILPLVEGWTRFTLKATDEEFKCYRNGDVLAVISGIGCERAELAARAVAKEHSLATLVSAGLAGALIRSLKVGNVILPGVIVNSGSGTEYRCDAWSDAVSGGVLVSSPEIAGAAAKSGLVDKFHALAVDMEAAGVARVARDSGLKLHCVKAISDEFDFRMPPLDRFIDQHGNMRRARFVSWVALRPQHWRATLKLASNSRRASLALVDWLRKNLTGKLPAGPVVTLDRADHLKT